MKLKLNHPVSIIVVAVIVSQAANWIVGTITDGVKEVHQEKANIDARWALSGFVPFKTLVKSIFPNDSSDTYEPSIDEELSFSEKARTMNTRLYALETRVSKLDGQSPPSGWPTGEGSDSISRDEQDLVPNFSHLLLTLPQEPAV